MNYELSELRNFKEELEAIKVINGYDPYDDWYVFFNEGNLKYSNKISLPDMKEAKFLAVFSTKPWNNGSKVGKRRMLAGFFGDDLQSLNRIPLRENCFLVDIKFTWYKHDINYILKPIFVIEDNTEVKELTIGQEEEKGCPDDLIHLYRKALEM